MSSNKQCGICGEALLSTDFSSGPSQHFCGLELNGAAIVRPGIISDPILSDMSATSSVSTDDEGDARLSAVAAHGLPTTAHNLVDLAEIGRLHMENEALKRTAQPAVMLSAFSNVSASSMTVPAGQRMAQEVAMPSGESIMVEVAVHTK
ncbi:hypothetical protein LTR10_002449 [Elasticomyces elasticus]|nr:hypothetical protein LTR10_002449 [Elasticomyces elasticus]KAK4973486.1 hypothetical protein LTR42_005474 [Elasticomyces elasticus]KAK5727434.1 hypothetical protein LTR15_003330 [Elasticomyces elasticus]